MKVLNFGSLNIDYVYKVDHFVRPGETILSDNISVFCGGKGLNQSIALAKAGAYVYHAGKVGHDGSLLINQLKECGVNTDYIQCHSGRSGHAIVQVDKRGQNCIILHGGANQTMTREYIDSVLENFDEGDIILLQNEINMLDYIINKAYKKGMKIALNPSPIDSFIIELNLKYISWLILNEIEGKEITGQSESHTIVDTLLKRYSNLTVVLTLGKKGVLYKSKEETYMHSAYNVPVVDTTGAGDTFTGYFLAGISNNLTVKEILKLASIASSIAVSRNGASDSIPFKQEVLRKSMELE